MSGLRAAVAFLTRIPANGTNDPGGAVAWFPVVGGLVGAVSGTIYVLAGSVTIPFLAAVAAVAVAVAVTGAFHEDGLADTFDGLSSIRTAERQIEIMRDSRLGAFGVVALVLVIVARVMAVGELAVAAETILVLGWLHALAAAVVIGVMLLSRPASVEGSGADYISRVRRPLPSAVAVLTAALGWFLVDGAVWGVVMAAALGPAAVAVWAHRRIGGVTGDVLGACQQLALVGGLAIVAV
ncbi:MAG: adenosylcobinamide-GDP ribazoletransferase [Acidimicrobiia bacterium]|nr:adenosylcobinamide-GDP ribazoletransferase [Acidimicrobiia bacterium]